MSITDKMSITKEKKIIVPTGLGNATPATVLKGITFTSDTGIKQTGTAEAERIEPILQEKTATENGDVVADAGYDGLSKVTVAVPAPEIPEVTSEEVTVTPTKAKQEITPTNADYISKAIVNPIPSEYVVPSGAVNISSNGEHSVSGKAKAVVNVPIPDGYVKPEGEVSITENGTHNISGKATAIVNVPAPEITTEDVQITPSEEKQEFTAGHADYINKVTVLPIPSDYIKPSGTKSITENGTHDVKTFESVSVNVPTSGGEGGDCARPHVIEVDTLPDGEAVDTNAVYFCDGAYHKPLVGFTDIVTLMGDQLMSFKELMSADGRVTSFNIIPTKTTDGILESDVVTTMHFYYIEDEDNIFMYGYGEWLSVAEFGMGDYGGKITDVSEVTTEGLVYAVIGGWSKLQEGTFVIRVAELPTENMDTNAVYFCNEKYYVYRYEVWTEYLCPTDTLTIKENGTFDVKQYESVKVNTPKILVVQTVNDLPNIQEGSVAYVLEG